MTTIQNDNVTVPGTLIVNTIVLSGGGLFLPVVSTSTDYTANISDETILVTVSGKTVTLPTAVGNTGKRFTVKLTVAGTATVATGGENIDGATTYSLAAQYNAVTVVSDGTQWWVTAKV